MRGRKQPSGNFASELAQRVTEALLQERFVPRFVDSYVVDHGRYALQTHAPRYRELLTLLAREALLVLTLCVLQEATNTTSKKRSVRRARFSPQSFRRDFLRALARQRNWSAGDALDFQADLRIYEQLGARSAARQSGKASSGADHPFVDRCAILLDPPFIEQARVAAEGVLRELEALASRLSAQTFKNDTY